jgi:hemolysin III
MGAYINSYYYKELRSDNMSIKVKDPFSGFSHLVGAVLSIIGLVLLVRYAVTDGTVWHIVAFSIFGASLILLYAASAFYHLLPLSEKGNRILRRIDHMMIYVLIAGSYTPFCLVVLRGVWGWSLLIPIWVIAVTGIVMTIWWLNAPRWLSTLLYAAMEWAVIIAVRPLIQSMPIGGFTWFLIGGMFYTVGAVIYGTKWPRLKPGIFGFHELWHLFVMAGSISHFWVVLRYVAVLP